MDIVEVVWVDSAVTSGWGHPSRVSDARRGLLECRTAGYLLGKDEKSIRLCLSHSADNGTVSEIMSIPRSCVKKVRRLYAR